MVDGQLSLGLAVGGFMGKGRVITAVLFLSLMGSVAQAEPPPDPGPGPTPDPTPTPTVEYDSSPTKYLMFFAMAREAGMRMDDSRLGYLIALEAEQKEIQLHSLNEKLHAKKAISEEDYRISLQRRDVAIARTRVLRDRIAVDEALFTNLKRQAGIGAGDPVDIDALYADYVAVWNAECVKYKSDIELAQAEFALANYRVTVARALAPGGSVSKYELIQREFELKAADERLKKEQASEVKCPNGIPTLEYVKSIPKK